MEVVNRFTQKIKFIIWLDSFILYRTHRLITVL